MPDVSLEWQDDFQPSPTGDLALSDGSDLARQRIVRRLCTAINGYIWELGYGGGLPQKIGRTAQPPAIQSLVRAQLKLEAAVSQRPPAQITVTEDAVNIGAFIITIVYVDANLGEQTSLSFSTATGQAPQP